LYSTTFSKVVLWKIILEQGKPQMVIWGMGIACWIPKATNTCSGCVTFIAFPLQQWLHECTWVLLYTYVYIACLMSSHRYCIFKTCGIRHVSISKYLPTFCGNLPTPSSDSKHFILLGLLTFWHRSFTFNSNKSST